MSNVAMLNGRAIQISKAYPRMQCSPEFERLQSPELVRSTNEWMSAFFGYTEMLPDGVVYELNRNTLVMNQATYIKLQAAIKEST